MNSDILDDTEPLQIVTLISWYLPGYKAGGPIRSIANLVARLGRDFHFRIVTSDRDLGDSSTYPGVPTGCWLPVGEAEVMYLPSGWRGDLKLARMLLSQDSKSVLYLNGFFARRSILALLMNRLGLLQTRHLLVAPQGEFSPGALGIKPHRKSLYIAMTSRLGFCRRVIWQASTKREAEDIRACFPNTRPVSFADLSPDSSQSDIRAAGSVTIIAKDIEAVPITTNILKPDDGIIRKKQCGKLRLVFVSRISPMKNLLTALNILKCVAGDVSFNIYGPAEDLEYWEKCKNAIQKLPANIQVRYMGMVEQARVHEVFADHDLFILPTLGENYGHVICESLIAGCPVLISDQTPWRNLSEIGVGWDIPLDEPERFREVLQQCVVADGEHYTDIVIRAREYGKKILCDPTIAEDYRRMFQYAYRVANPQALISKMKMNEI